MATKLDVPDIQGLLARGYRGLRYARFTIFGIPGAAAGQALLSWLVPQVTTAGRFAADSALHVAFTAAGLRRLGLPDGVIAGFSAEFAEGMTGPDRSRFLSDVGASSPGSWAWGGPQGPPVDALVLLYAATPQALDRRHDELARRLVQAGARHVIVLDTRELSDNEPFGFHDGISQPVIDGLPRASQGVAAGGGRAVAAGEFVLGYRNAYGQYTGRPLLPASADPDRLLSADPERSGAADLGRNGCYLVLRQLEQDVGAFWRYVRQATARPDGSADTGSAIALAAKLVGRWPSGAPLVKAPDRDNPQLRDDNDFRYYHADPLGLACPLGSHIRRVNPRDSLDPEPAASLDATGRHRLLRRGRRYGMAGHGRYGTGLYFICLVADLARQFEFVQHTWLDNPTFSGLYDDADPLAGSRRPSGGTFTAPARPVRHRYLDLPRFVRTRAGAYFFLPGVSAMRYLAQLQDTGPPPSAGR